MPSPLPTRMFYENMNQAEIVEHFDLTKHVRFKPGGLNFSGEDTWWCLECDEIRGWTVGEVTV